MPVIPVLIVLVAVLAIMCGGYFFLQGKKEGKPIKAIKKNLAREDAIKEAEKRIKRNPRDPAALAVLANIHFEDKRWKEALTLYETLANMPTTEPEPNPGLVNYRAAICSLQLGDTEAAYKYLVIANALDGANFKITSQLGALEYKRGNIDKAVFLLQKSLKLQPSYVPTLKTLGSCYIQQNKITEAMACVKKVLESVHNDKESLFNLAKCYVETERKDQALKIYTLLRSDETWGAESCLEAGLINLETRHTDQAIGDFEIGLRHTGLKPEIEMELKYQLGCIYIERQEIDKAMKYLLQVEALAPGQYKNTPQLIEKYREMTLNENLKIYLLGSAADFMALCKKIVLASYLKSKVKINKTQFHGNEWLDILATIDTPKWSDVVLFRFVRTQGNIGELIVREFQGHLKEAKAGKGICIGAGSFTDEARHFVESRLIDIIDRDKLSVMLNGLDEKLSSSLQQQAKEGAA